MDRKAHWERVYSEKGPDQVSWYQAEATRSLEIIKRVAPPPGSFVLDIGAGASTLVDGLLDAGYRRMTVLDLSSTALERTRQRLGDSAGRVEWLEADVLTASLPVGVYDVWHDRAVFHFLTSHHDRARYVAQVRRTVRRGGFVLIATFAEDGPERCSGLDVVRYSPRELHGVFGPEFRLVESQREEHVTPSGATQRFTYCLCCYEPPLESPDLAK